MPSLFLSSACDVCMPQPKLPRAQTSWQTELAEDPCRIQPVPIPETWWHMSLLTLSAGTMVCCYCCWCK